MEIQENIQEVLPGVFEIRNVLENPERIISLSKEYNDQWQSSSVIERGGTQIDKEHRSSLSFPLDPSFKNPVEWFYISKLLWMYGDEYAKFFKIGFSAMEMPGLLHYSGSSDFYHSHSDDGPGTNRIFSALLYLNDVEEGGETHFTHFNFSIKPEPGKLILFPSNYIYEHEARPPIKGEKYVVVTWFEKELLHAKN